MKWFLSFVVRSKSDLSTIDYFVERLNKHANAGFYNSGGHSICQSFLPVRNLDLTNVIRRENQPFTIDSALFVVTSCRVLSEQVE